MHLRTTQFDSRYAAKARRSEQKRWMGVLLALAMLSFPAVTAKGAAQDSAPATARPPFKQHSESGSLNSADPDWRPDRINIPLERPAESDEDGRVRGGSGARAATTVFASLLVVIAAFLGVVWFIRRSYPQSNQKLPTEALELLGRTPLTGRLSLQLLRLGKRVVLVCVSPDGAEVITEVQDDEEAEHLVALCKQAEPNSISSTFRDVINQLGSEKQSGELSRS